MIHNNKQNFLKLLESISAKTSFPIRLLEKDYYLTLLLKDINEKLDDKLVFKGGTCLNKIYFEYFRLSEDLDFTILLPSDKINRKIRSDMMEKIKKGIKNYVELCGLNLDETQKPAHNENKQYIYIVQYDSLITNSKENIKIEIGLRFNPYMPPKKLKIKHIFRNPFTNEELFEAGVILCLDLYELAAEKFRAAVTRKLIAPRDFYDLNYFIKTGFNFNSKQFQQIAAKKLAEEGYNDEIKRYFINLGRTKEEIDEMKKRIEDELFDVLTYQAAKEFDVDFVLNYFNNLITINTKE